MKTILLPILITLIFSTTLPACSCASDSNAELPTPVEASDTLSRYLICLDSMPDHGCVKLPLRRRVGYLGRTFNDSNYLHIQAATAIGIEPLNDLAGTWHATRPLVKIRTCRDFYIDRLTHSLPYLVPEAATLLHDIGRSFRDSLAARGGGSYRIKVTSVLRTPATIARLRRRNANAVDTSAHQFGTTFDISYAKFICDSITVSRTQEDLKNLLAEILLNLRDSSRCYVKYERRQACFHITARPLTP